MEEAKPAYHDEIERILDIAVANENTRLAEGGAGVGDEMIDVRKSREALDISYPPAFPEKTLNTPIGYPEDIPDFKTGERADTMATAPVQTDAYQKIVAPGTFETQIAARLAEIRSRVMSYPGDVRADVGFLLVVIDAYENGKL